MFCIVFIYLTTNTQFYFIRKLDLLSIEVKISNISFIHLIWKWKFLIFHPILIIHLNLKFSLCIQTKSSLDLWSWLGKWIFFRPSLQLIKPCRSSLNFNLVLIDTLRSIYLGLDFSYLQIMRWILTRIKTDRIWMIFFLTAFLADRIICQALRGEDC
jgi:hypothetical protein